MIGSASTKEKCDWLKELGFDHVFNYRETSVAEALQKYAPNGVDCYFDNVSIHNIAFQFVCNFLRIRKTKSYCVYSVVL